MKQFVTQNQDVKKDHIKTAQDAVNLCNRLYGITTDLIEVLDKETELVRTSNFKDFSALNLRKKALTSSLTHDMDHFKRNIDYIKTTVPDQIRILKEQQTQFHSSLEINHKALSAMKALSEQLLQTISLKVKQKRSGPEVYGIDAGLKVGAKHSTGAISVDTNL